MVMKRLIALLVVLFSFIAVGNIFAIDTEYTQYDITINYRTNEAESTTIYYGNGYYYGDVVTLDFEELARLNDKVFAFYVFGTSVYFDAGADFVVTSHTVIEVFLKYEARTILLTEETFQDFIDQYSNEVFSPIYLGFPEWWFD